MADGHTPIVEAPQPTPEPVSGSWRWSTSVDKIAPALVAMQAEVKNPSKNKTAKLKGQSRNGNDFQFEYKYADIADVLSDCLPTLSSHKLCLIQLPDPERGVIVTRLMHESGQFVEADYPWCDTSRGMSHQDMGAASTYARRYGACPMIGVAAEEDTDGQNAAETAPVRKKKGAAQAKREGDFEKFKAHVTAKAAEGPEAIRSWINSAPMEEWFSGFTQHWADGCRDHAEAEAKSLESKTKRGRKRQADDAPYAEESIEPAQAFEVFKEFCADCSVPTEIIQESQRLLALPDMKAYVADIEQVQEKRIKELEGATT